MPKNIPRPAVLGLCCLFSATLIHGLIARTDANENHLADFGRSELRTSTEPSSPTPTPTTLRLQLPRVEPEPAELSAGEVFDLMMGTPDVDCDGVPNREDNCKITFNPDQEDTDKDGTGDVCEGDNAKLDSRCDLDGDGIFDRDDNCPLVCNPDQTDKNKNGTGDVCDFAFLDKWERYNPCTKTTKRGKPADQPRGSNPGKDKDKS